MKVFGADLPRQPGSGQPENTLVQLDGDGQLIRVEHPPSIPALTAEVAARSESSPFLLGLDVPVVVPVKPARSRPVENLVRRRFGFRIASGGRIALGSEPQGIVGETVIAGLAAAGHPCLTYPDRDRRSTGLLETHPALVLKSLLWEQSAFAADETAPRDELFRAASPPEYRAADLPARCGWAEQAGRIEMLLRLVGNETGFDFSAAQTALARTSNAVDSERAAAILDATLIAGTARRYLEAPESCLFIGDHESGYLILPADSFVRRLALSDTRKPTGQLFPQASLRQRLGGDAHVRAVDLVHVPGRPQRTEARFDNPPQFEFDNLDEMLWWKHCRHLSGPLLPTEGLRELRVVLGGADAPPLTLARSRHRTLSFRFEPPTAWRTHLSTRDGKTYPFRVVRALYETLPPSD